MTDRHGPATAPRRRHGTSRQDTRAGDRGWGERLDSITGRLRAGVALAGLLLAGAVAVSVVSGVHAQRAVSTMTQVVAPLQAANAGLRSGFSQCESTYASYRLGGAGSGAYRACGASFRHTLASALRSASQARASLVPLVLDQERAARKWFQLTGKTAAPGTPATAASASFFTANAAMQRQIDQARVLATGAEQTSLTDELRYGVPLGLLALVWLLLGARVFARGVLRPLASLNPTLKRLTRGDHAARTTVTRPAEIARVARAIDTLAEEIESGGQRARLMALAQAAGNRVRIHLNESAVIREATTALRRDFGIDMAFVMLAEDGRLGPPRTTLETDALDIFARLPADAELWLRQALYRLDVIDDARRCEAHPLVPAAIFQALLSRGFLSGIFLPVHAGGQPLGVIAGLRRGLGMSWCEAETDALEWLAADIGRALKHAQTFGTEEILVENFRSLDQAKTDFMANVSHELRTPLTSIAGYVEVLRDGDAGVLSTAQDNVLETIDRNTTRLRNLIEDVLTLSKIETRGFKTATRSVPLVKTISSVVAAMDVTARKKGLELRLDAPHEELTVKGDAGQLDRAIMNLLSNAVKFTPPGGSVAVTVHHWGGTAVVKVTDTGIGIPEKDKGNLFSRFFRASNAVHMAMPGTGLGLSIVRTIVANHGGELDVDSREGAGTTVSISLPMVPASLPGGQEAPPADAGRAAAAGAHFPLG